MTKSNRKRITLVTKSLNKAVKENCNAETSMYVLIEAMTNLIFTMSDLHFRPEINSERGSV